ncbi:gastrokine-1-like [Malurus melanocephalus]|uniref:gastrokine-1-like n=1 Tax=Malurus melanocephalus TaxID=175006 RepID=UPI002546E014|nr:gastrokine-1-like [Malurus melanocephalus]
MTFSSRTNVVVIEQRSDQLSWKTIWNYNTGIIATKLMQERTCYISSISKNEMPSLKNLTYLASQKGNQIGLGRPARKITFVANGLVNNLSSYGADVFSMCSGLTTYMAYEVHGFFRNATAHVSGPMNWHQPEFVVPRHRDSRERVQ